MIVAETLLAVTLMSSLPKKRSGQERDYVYSSNAGNCFEIASGMSLERTVNTEIEELPGVHSVAVKRNSQTSFVVDVVMETLEFSTYQKVIEKELDLFDQFPALTFEFNVVPLAAVQGTSPVSHAA